jgi:hypothetical protein
VITISNKPRELFEAYVAFCERAGVLPMTEEMWRWASDNKPFISMFSNWDERLRPPPPKPEKKDSSTERMRRLRERRRAERENQ